VAVSAYFQDEIDEVDDTKTLVFTTNTVDYDFDEWSYNGLEVTGYDDFALTHGASALLYAMGYRFYGPKDQFTKRPASIATDLVQATTTDWIPSVRVYLGYGYDDRFDSNLRQAEYDKWAILNACYSGSSPVGHRWASIIDSPSGVAYLAANPSMKIPNTKRFNLSVAEPDYSNMVHFCAAWMLDFGSLNAYNRSYFDPTDGDGQSSDLVAAFTKAVVDKMRLGTEAIGTIAAQAAVPTAQLGIYAYGGHRAPPLAITDMEGVYIQVALGFNDTEFTYQEIVEGWGELTDFVGLREYFDVMAWTKGQPRTHGRNVRSYYSRYDAFRDAGVRNVTGEFQANWLCNMVAMYTGLRVMKTGDDALTTFDQVQEDLVNDIFSGDDAVAALYANWSKGSLTPNKYSLKTWADLVSLMAAGWYKNYFEQYIVILYEFQNLPSQGDSVNFPIEFTKLMTHVYGVMDDHWYHSYAMARRIANGEVATTYPDLRMNQGPGIFPDWMANRAAPTHDEFLQVHALLTGSASRPSELDSSDLVVMKVTPLNGTTASNNPTSKIVVNGASTFCVVGPGTVTWTPESTGVATAYDYAAGKHIVSARFATAGSLIASNGAKIFVNAFPQYKAPSVTANTADLWMYVPIEVAGVVDLEPTGRISLNWTGTRVDIGEATAEALLPTIPSGQIRIVINSSGTTNSNQTFGNVNPWLSPYPDFALMSRPLAEKDFPARVTIGVPAFADTDDTADPVLDEPQEPTDE
jgi:hypothetical protein